MTLIDQYEESEKYNKRLHIDIDESKKKRINMKDFPKVNYYVKYSMSDTILLG